MSSRRAQPLKTSAPKSRKSQVRSASLSNASVSKASPSTAKPDRPNKSRANKVAAADTSAHVEKIIEQAEQITAAVIGKPVEANGAKLAEPATKANHEIVALMSRRTQALATLPTQIAGCRTPLDFWKAQFGFIQGMLADYQAASHHMFDMLKMPGSERRRERVN